MAKTRRPAHSSKSITLEDLAQNFHLPINDVARKLGLCVTVLKQRCRENGIMRWPYRKVRKLDNLISALEPMPVRVEPVPVPMPQAKVDPATEDIRRLEAARETRNFLLANPNSTVHLTVGRVKTPRRKNGESDRQSGEKSTGGQFQSENQQQVADTASSSRFYTGQQVESATADRTEEVDPTVSGHRAPGVAAREACTAAEYAPGHSGAAVLAAQEELRSFKPLERSSSFLRGSGSAFRPMDKAAFRPMERSSSLSSLLSGMEDGRESPFFAPIPSSTPHIITPSPSPHPPIVPTPSPHPIAPLPISPAPHSIPNTPSPPPGYSVNSAANLAYLQAWVQQHAAASAHQAAAAAAQQAARQAAGAHPSALAQVAHQGNSDVVPQGGLPPRYSSPSLQHSGAPLGGHWPVPGMLELAHMAAWNASNASWNANMSRVINASSNVHEYNNQPESLWQLQAQPSTATLA